MEFTVTYVCSQIAVILTYIFFIVTYQVKKRKTILILSMLANVWLGISYFLLSAWAGVATSIIALARSIVFMKFVKEDKVNKTEIAILGVFGALILVAGIITYEGLLSLLPIFATLVYTYAVWQKDTHIYKQIGALVSVIWIAYNIYVQSILGVVFETMMVISAVIGLIKDKRNKLNKFGYEEIFDCIIAYRSFIGRLCTKVCVC